MSELDELRDLVISRGYDGNKLALRFWSKKKLEIWLADHPAPATTPELRETLGAEQVEQAAQKEQEEDTDVDKNKKPKAFLHPIVTYMGPNKNFAHNPVQAFPKISFPKRVPVDLLVAMSGECGNGIDAKEIKTMVKEMAVLYKAKAKQPGSHFRFHEEALNIKLPGSEIDNTSPLENLFKVLEEPVDVVMSYVRKLRSEEIEPPFGTVHDVVQRLYWLEADHREFRPALLSWLRDESRELQGLPRLKAVEEDIDMR